MQFTRRYAINVDYLHGYHAKDKDGRVLVSENHNAPFVTVGELSASIKRTLESAFVYVRVKGEISRPSFPGSGHVYFTLKDESHNLGAVVWRGVANTLDVRPEEGLEVIATGKLTSFSGQSKYQLVVRQLEVAGEGALLKQLEERKRRLEAEGLFAQEHKKQLPAFPKTIGIVTSPTGAVIQDILHRLGDRFGVHVIVWPVLVQGQGSAEQVVDAINGFNHITKDHHLPRPDLLIIARGGGSLEDLMSFNDERVVRAAAASDIPLISSIGHETDTTLLDFVADRRAPTPTAAAEMATAVKAEISARITEWDSRQKTAMVRRLQEAEQFLAGAIRGLAHPIEKVNAQSQALDFAFTNLVRFTDRRLYDGRQKLHDLASRLSPPHQQLARMTRRFDAASDKLVPLMRNRLERHQTHMDGAARLLEANSFTKVLERGFALVRDESGAPVKQAKGLGDGARISITFADDSRDAIIGDAPAAPAQRVPTGKPSAAKATKAAKKPSSDDGQTELF